MPLTHPPALGARSDRFRDWLVIAGCLVAIALYVVFGG